MYGRLLWVTNTIKLHFRCLLTEQQSSLSEDSGSSSDDESDINMLGTTHAYQSCNMPIEGTIVFPGLK